MLPIKGNNQESYSSYLAPVDPRFLNNQNGVKDIALIFQSRIQPNDIGHYSPDLLNNIIYPALESRSALIRRPKLDEKNLIEKKFNEGENIPNKLFKNNGLYTSLDGHKHCLLVLETKLEGSKKSKVYGAIHYIFENERMDHYLAPSYADGKCHIESISIHEKCRGRKFGTLLLGAALEDARAVKSKTAYLEGADHNRGFYLINGFVPNEVLEVDDDECWDEMSLGARILIAQENTFDHLSFDLARGNIDLLDDAFSSESVKSMNEEPEIIRIPKKAVKLGWINPEEFEEGYIEIYDDEDSSEIDTESSSEAKVRANSTAMSDPEEEEEMPKYVRTLLNHQAIEMVFPPEFGHPEPFKSSEDDLSLFSYFDEEKSDSDDPDAFMYLD